MQFGKSYAFDSFSQICLNLPLWFGHVWASCCHPHPLLNYSIQCSMHRQPARIGISPAFCEDRLGPAFTVNARTLSAHLIHAMPSRFSRLPGAVGVESALGSLTFFCLIWYCSLSEHACVRPCETRTLRSITAEGIGFHALLNYCGGAFVYVRREYAGAVGLTGNTVVANSGNSMFPKVSATNLVCTHCL